MPAPAKNVFYDEANRDLLQQRLRANGRRLASRDVQVLLLRAGLADGRHHSYREIGEQFGVTDNRVRQIERAALATLAEQPDLGPYSPAGPDSQDTATEALSTLGLDTEPQRVPGEVITLVTPGVPLTPTQARTLLFASTARTGDQLRQLLASWLATVESEHTRQAYLRDISEYFDFCIAHDLDPLTMRIQDFNVFTTWLRMQTSRVGRPYSAPTRSRKISAVSSFYQHLLAVEAVDRNPVTKPARPLYTRRAADKAITVEETIALIDDAARGSRTLGASAAALAIELLFTMGLRVTEVCNLDIDQLTWVDNDGRRYRQITFIGKGNREHIRGIPARLDAERLTPYLAVRPKPATVADGPALLLTKTGRRVTRHQVASLLRSAEKRGVVTRHVTPHSGRHTFNRRGIESSIAVEDRSSALGHASISTTQGYGQARNDVMSDPSHTIADRLHAARSRPEDPRNKL
jgi:integrase/recombinase XerD